MMEHIINRTLIDCNNSNNIIRNKIQKGGFNSLTEEEIEILKKGTFTIDIINRIESNQSELKNMLNSIGYYGIDKENKQWNEHDCFFKEDFERLVYISKKLLSSMGMKYYNISNERYYHFDSINKLEMNNMNSEKFYNQILNNYKYCGDYYCGG